MLIVHNTSTLQHALFLQENLETLLEIEKDEVLTLLVYFQSDSHTTVEQMNFTKVCYNI